MERLRLGGYQPERSVHTRGLRVIGREIGAGLQGRVAVDVIAQITAQGHAAADLLALTEGGDLDVCYFASSYLANRVPELTILDLPFPGGDRAAMWRRLDGEAGRLLKAAVRARTGFEVLAFWDNGIRHVSNGVRPIRSPADCKGLSIRTLDNGFHQRVFRSIGFEPRFIDVKDLAETIRSRAIDAQENPLTNLINFEVQKTHRYVSLTGHFFGIALLLTNQKFLAGLSAGDLAVFEQAVEVATRGQRSEAAQEDSACLAQLQREGVQVIEADALDLAAFKASVADAASQEAKALDPELLAAWGK